AITYAPQDGERWFVQTFSGYPLPNPPAWVRDTVFYQIFPERFANGDPSNDGPGVAPWGAPPTATNRMGGDLAGIKARIDHLKELGVTALYLNPVFEALSNHAYDTVDYTKVDPRFGTNAELAALVSALKSQGIRTILDGVFNHSSPEFFAFRDLREKGAASTYREWFHVLKLPIVVGEGQQTYRTFAGVPTMPKLNQDHPAARQYFLGIARRWIEDAGIAGWRLDVADEVSQSFWRAFRVELKKAQPDAFMLGEVWGDAHEYLQGDQHDSVMNYRWRKAVLDLLAYKTATIEETDRVLRRLREDYPDATLLSMVNLLGSHDTPRVRTIFGSDRARQALAHVLQFTYPGVPMIYYGDEVGLEGGRDPDCRRAMPWDRSGWDGAQFALTKSLVALRQSRSSLRRGSYRTVRASNRDGIFAFDRRDGSQTTRVYLNLGDEPRRLAVSSGASLLLGATARVSDGMVELGPLSWGIVDLK
ncbi:MAG TPA: glycoside hydrolase family 13 protein, partial [Fimbriimonadaceae bacterium]|nr:glycoside hydrolase family 13 protein [Fimbriimonadaceae bacterium]